MTVQAKHWRIRRPGCQQRPGERSRVQPCDILKSLSDYRPKEQSGLVPEREGEPYWNKDRSIYLFQTKDVRPKSPKSSHGTRVNSHQNQMPLPLNLQAGWIEEEPSFCQHKEPNIPTEQSIQHSTKETKKPSTRTENLRAKTTEEQSRKCHNGLGLRREGQKGAVRGGVQGIYSRH